MYLYINKFKKLAIFWYQAYRVTVTTEAEQIKLEGCDVITLVAIV